MKVRLKLRLREKLDEMKYNAKYMDSSALNGTNVSRRQFGAYSVNEQTGNFKLEDYANLGAVFNCNPYELFYLEDENGNVIPYPSNKK